MLPIKISELSNEQKAQFPFYVKKWTDFGLSTEPTNKEMAEEGVKLAYQAAKKPPPLKYFWLKSPMGGAILYEIFKNQSVGASVGASVMDSGGASVWDSVRDSVGAACYGQHDASWIGFYDFFREASSLKEETEPLLGLTKTVMACGWWWPFENAVILTDRPSELHRDQRGRLHKDGGASLLYQDGWGLYRWHGVNVPKKYIVTPADEIDVVEVLKESNSSVRMAVIQKVGFLRLKSQLKNSLISKTDSADLLEFDLGEIKVRGLHVRWEDKFKTPLETIIPVPRTKSQFGEDCPDNIDDAEQVRRWTLHMKKEEQLVIET